jgi:MoaA/NifB/PqqE/SkfB family radical SAM enzyme
MRTAGIPTNLRCNQHCVYCDRRSAEDDLAAIQPRVIQSAISRAVGGGVSDIILTGGEPTLRRDVAELVAHACASGAERVFLQTNATLLDAERARALAQAGLAAVWVNLSGWGDALDEVTRDPGGFRRTLAGIEAALGAGLRVRIESAVVERTRPLLHELPARLAQTFGAERIELISLVVPVAGPNPSELASYEEAAETILAIEASARTAGIWLQMGPDAPPPCVFPPSNRTVGIYALTPGGVRTDGFVKPDACRECLVSDRCSGFSTAYTRPLPPLHPIVEDRMRRRLSVISTVRDQIDREFVQVDRFPGSAQPTQETIRVVFHCNQACHFCFVSTHLPAVDEERVRAAIVAAGARGSQIVLSGGEPTLHPKLPAFVALAKASSRHPVVLQTNAVRLADPALVSALAGAGLDSAFVSLHGATAEVSDRVTDAPGTFVRTIAGIDALSASPLGLTLNFVTCRLNFHQMPDVARMIGQRWPRARLNISFVAPSADVVPKETTLVPRYSDVYPFLATAADEALRLRVPVTGPGRACGIPRCLVPPSQAFDDVEGGLAESIGEYTKPDACASCAETTRCYGLRKSYVAIYGAAEVRPIG